MRVGRFDLDPRLIGEISKIDYLTHEQMSGMTLAFIKANFLYDAPEHTHHLKQPLLDQIKSQTATPFHSLIGMDSTSVLKTLGAPDYRENAQGFGYQLGACPVALNCDKMFLKLTFSDKGICSHADLETSIKPVTQPNGGMKRSPHK